MNEPINKTHYSIKEIKEMFKNVQKDNQITDIEYEIFCEGIHCLPLEVVDKIKEDVYFVILSSHKTQGGPACWLDIKCLKNKNGIIFLSLLVFKDEEVRKNITICLIKVSS